MSTASDAWDAAGVRRWLQARVAAARLDQAAADQRGYAARDDYDAAAAEEWVCRALHAGASADERVAFAARIKVLLAQADYPITGIYDDRRVDRHVRAVLRKIAKMAKANDGFANIARYQG